MHDPWKKMRESLDEGYERRLGECRVWKSELCFSENTEGRRGRG